MSTIALAEAATALLMILFHVINVWRPFLGEQMNQNTHLGFCLILSALHKAREAESASALSFRKRLPGDGFSPKPPGRKSAGSPLFFQGKNDKGKWIKALYLISIPLSLFPVVYMAIHHQRLVFNAGWPEPTDIFIGVLLILMVTGWTGKHFGAIFPVMILAGLGYLLWGHRIPGVMGHPPMDFGYIVSNLSVGFQGIYGMLLSLSVNVLFLLVIFGSLFHVTGVTQFFSEAGLLPGSRFRGGTGHSALVISFLMGMVNGIAPANVAMTGPFTISLMKKNGFRSETAAAVEAVASTGGQLTPPVMGVAIFVMAGFLGINYQSLILKTLVPALVFYVAVTAGICILANRDDIPVILRKANKKFLLTRLPVFLLPTCTLFIMLFLKYSIGFATFWAIVCLIFVAGIQKQTRPGIKALLENLTKAAVMAAGFGIACACIGIFIKCLTLSGAATKLAIMVEYVSDGRLLPLLLFTMALSVLLSSSLPTVAAYIIVAFFCAPVLVATGIPTVRAHLFVFYFAVLAGVIPPIAGTAIVAAKIADADYVKTAWESFKLALPFFPLPFFLVKNPVFLLENQPFSEAVPAIAALITASASLVCFSGKFCLAPNRKADHVLLLFIAFSGIFYGLYHIFIWLAVSVILMGIYLTIQKKRKKLQHNPHKTL